MLAALKTQLFCYTPYAPCRRTQGIDFNRFFDKQAILSCIARRLHTKLEPPFYEGVAVHGGDYGAI